MNNQFSLKTRHKSISQPSWSKRIETHFSIMSEPSIVLSKKAFLDDQFNVQPLYRQRFMHHLGLDSNNVEARMATEVLLKY